MSAVRADIRLLPFALAGGPANMAADEVMLNSATQGIASLRFYGWSENTVSLGYFQELAVHADNSDLCALPVVRRPSGGKTLVHHHELTYAFALPPGSFWQPGGRVAVPWLCRMHQIIARALAAVGVSTLPAKCHCAAPTTSPLCFHSVTAGDLLIGTSKIVGSAQRRRLRALLQHGSILLETNVHAPQLKGIRELTGQRFDIAQLAGAIEVEFTKDTRWGLTSSPWSYAEMEQERELQSTKYANAGWTGRR